MFWPDNLLMPQLCRCRKIPPVILQDWSHTLISSSQFVTPDWYVSDSWVPKNLSLIPSWLKRVDSWQKRDNDTLKELLKTNVELPIKMVLYNSKTQTVRETTVTPSNTWGGQGLLGVSIRFCSFEGANQNVWHVLVSPEGGQVKHCWTFWSYTLINYRLWVKRLKRWIRINSFCLDLVTKIKSVFKCRSVTDLLAIKVWSCFYCQTSAEVFQSHVSIWDIIKKELVNLQHLLPWWSSQVQIELI